MLGACSLLMAITPNFWTIWTYFTEVKTSVWALMETLILGTAMGQSRCFASIRPFSGMCILLFTLQFNLVVSLLLPLLFANPTSIHCALWAAHPTKGALRLNTIGPTIKSNEWDACQQWFCDDVALTNQVFHHCDEGSAFPKRTTFCDLLSTLKNSLANLKF